jgi:hypothetical protein
MSDLRPCPFCGGKAIYDKSYKIDCYNGCTSVEAWADNRTGSNKEIVKEKWNSRPMLDEAVEIIEVCQKWLNSVKISSMNHIDGNRLKDTKERINNFLSDLDAEVEE